MTRQQSRFFALMQDYDRTMYLVNSSTESSGRAQKQFALYSNSLEAATNRLTNQWEIFFNSITKGNGILVTFENTLSKLLEILNHDWVGPIKTLFGLVDITKGLNSAKAGMKAFSDNIKAGKVEYDYSGTKGISSILATPQVTDLGSQIVLIQKEINNLGKESKGATGLVKRGFLEIEKGTLYARKGVEFFGATIKSIAKTQAILFAIQLAFTGISKIVEVVNDKLGIATEKYTELANVASENANTTESLLSEYEELSKKTELTTDEQERMKEITSELTEVSSELGAQLKANGGTYEDNIEIMKEYVKQQKQIYDENTLKTAQGTLKKSGGSFLANPLQIVKGGYDSLFSKIFGKSAGEQEEIQSYTDTFRTITDSLSSLNDLDEVQQSILTDYSEQLIENYSNLSLSGEQMANYGKDFEQAIKQYIDGLLALTDAQKDTYNELQALKTDDTISLSKYGQTIEQSNLPTEVYNNFMEDYNSKIDQAMSAISNNPFIENQSTIRQIASNLPRNYLEKLFNVDSSLYSDSEYLQYQKELSNLVSGSNLTKFLEAVNKGEEEFQNWALSLEGNSTGLEIFQEIVTGGLTSLSSVVEKAKTDFENLSSVIDGTLIKGTFSQLDVINGLLDGTINMSDLRVTSLGGGDSIMSTGFGSLLTNYNSYVNSINNTFDKQLTDLNNQLDKMQAVRNGQNVEDARMAYQNKLTEQSNLVSRMSTFDQNSEEYKKLNEQRQENINQLSILDNNIAVAREELDKLNNSQSEEAIAFENTTNQIENQIDKVKQIKNAVVDFLNQDLDKINNLTSVFETFQLSGQINTELDKLSEAYALAGEGASNYYEIAAAIAADPSLVDLLDTESEYLDFSIEKINQKAKAAIEAQISELEAQQEGTKLKIELLRAQMEGNGEEMQQEIANDKNKAQLLAKAISYNDAYLQSDTNLVNEEANNLFTSQSNWETWGDNVKSIINSVDETRAGFIQNVLSDSVSPIKQTEYNLKDYNTSRYSSTSTGITTQTTYDFLEELNQMTPQELEENLKYAEQAYEIQEKALNSLREKASNVNSEMGKRAGEDSAEETIVQFERFYNYLRKIEQVETQINIIRNKRNIIDSSHNNYIENLKTENSLLKSQAMLYNQYINSESKYLEQLRNEIMANYGDLATFDSNGGIQLKYHELRAGDESSAQRIEDFETIVNKYQEEYQNNQDNINKLYELEQAQLENISSMYSKILEDLDNVTDRLKNVNNRIEHQIDMTNDYGKQLELLNSQLDNTIKMWNVASQTVATLKADAQEINKAVSSSQWGQYLTWDEQLGQYNTTDAFNDLVNNSKDTSQEFFNMVTWVEGVAKASQEVANNLDSAQQSVMDAESTLKSIVEEQLSKITEVIEGWGKELNTIFDTIDSEINRFKTEGELLGKNDNYYSNYLSALEAEILLARKSIADLKDQESSLLSDLINNYGQYISIIGDSIYVNKTAIEQAQNLNEIDYQILQQKIEAYETMVDTIDNASNAIYNASEEMQQLYETGYQNIIDLRQEIHDILKDLDQQEIDDLQKKYDEMTKIDNEYFDSLNQKIEDARQKREMQQSSTEIGQMQNRLNVLQRDNTGIYNSEILDLQQQINEALQAQADQEVDLELERIQREQEQRAEEMEMQITQLENLMTFKDENGQYWTEAKEIWQTGYASIYGFLSTWYSAQDISDLELKTKLDEARDKLDLSLSTFMTIFEQKVIETNSLNQALIGTTNEVLNRNLTMVDNDINNGLNVLGSRIVELQIPERIVEGTNTVTNAVNNIITNFEGTIRSIENASNNIYNRLGNLNDSFNSKGTDILSSLNSIGTKIDSLDSGVKTIKAYTESSYNSSSGGGGGYSHSYGGDFVVRTNGNSVTTYSNPVRDFIEAVQQGRVNPDWRDISRFNTGDQYLKRQIANKYGFYKKGGYVDYTGPAMVHGTKANPEAFLNAQQTKLFEQLRDRLGSSNDSFNKLKEENVEVNNDNISIDKIEINVKEVAEVESVNKIIKATKDSIYKDATNSATLKLRRR